MRPIDADALKKKKVRSTERCEWVVPVAEIDWMPTIEPERKTGKWIPCSERLPEPRTDVWVNSDIGQIQGYYEENVKIWYASFGQGRDYLELIVNAWMPLPKPYQEDKQ